MSPKSHKRETLDHTDRHTVDISVWIPDVMKYIQVSNSVKFNEAKNNSQSEGRVSGRAHVNPHMHTDDILLFANYSLQLWQRRWHLAHVHMAAVGHSVGQRATRTEGKEQGY